ncbi:MAG TPA: sigma-70 family RNA polymerase sigma factor [Phycisphaerae bacterium]|nr:sigma-70 family RNA polymerase sigma factor [Phycisphaerae bacterium]
MFDANQAKEETQTSDHALLRRIASGDREALAALVRRHQERVLTLAFRFLGRWDAAEDVCQDVFLRIFQKAGAYRPDAQFTTWLYRIVANRCWDHRRKSSREPLAQADPDAAVSRSDGASRVDREERQEAIRRAVAALPDRQRLALVMHRFEGLSHAAIAEATGWSVGAVESCIVRAYASLRERLAELQYEK